MIFKQDRNPIELLAYHFLPLGVVLGQKFLLRFVVVREGARFLHHEADCLLFHGGKLVHVLTGTVVLLGLGVSDGLAETKCQSLTIGAVSLEPLVVLVEVVDTFYGLELNLKFLFGLAIKTTIIIIEASADGVVVLSKLILDQVADCVEDHSDVETSHTGLEADLISGFFQDHLLTLELFVSVIKLGDLSNNPECLSVKLLLKVSIEHIVEFDVVTDSCKGKNITEGGAVILDTFLGFLLKGLELLVENFVGLRLQLNQESEKTNEVEKTTNSDQ